MLLKTKEACARRIGTLPWSTFWSSRRQLKSISNNIMMNSKMMCNWYYAEKNKQDEHFNGWLGVSHFYALLEKILSFYIIHWMVGKEAIRVSRYIIVYDRHLKIQIIIECDLSQFNVASFPYPTKLYIFANI